MQVFIHQKNYIPEITYYAQNYIADYYIGI